MRKIHAPTPIFTNAHLNRVAAIRLFEAGYTLAEIVEEFPEVFKLDKKGRIGQIYQGQYLDTGLLETDYLIHSEVVDELVKAKADLPAKKGQAYDHPSI